MLSVALKNGRKINLPRTRGEWSDPDKPGDSDWIPDPEETFSYKGEDIAYGELMEKYGFDRITYRKQLPDFDSFADGKLGEPYFETMPDERTGGDGSYRQASEWVVSNMSGFSSAQEVEEYMNEHDLVWHEVDLHHVIAIPGEINTSFIHIGGIGLGNNLARVGELISEKTGGQYTTE